MPSVDGVTDHSSRLQHQEESSDAFEVDPKVIRVLGRAQKKFDQLDTNSDGMLDERELLGLADWVWGSFHPGGRPLSQQERRAEADKLLGRLDANQDQQMDFDEFADWWVAVQS